MRKRNEGDPVAQIHGKVTGGLGDPLPRRMSGRPQDVDPAGPYFDHDKHIQAAQEDRVEVEEIAGQQACAVPKFDTGCDQVVLWLG
jgi:hypothetical protein